MFENRKQMHNCKILTNSDFKCIFKLFFACIVYIIYIVQAPLIYLYLLKNNELYSNGFGQDLGYMRYEIIFRRSFFIFLEFVFHGTCI